VRRVAVALAGAAVGWPLGGCYAERERLDTPIVDLVLAARQVAAGDSIRGTLEARDASGIVDWVVTARSPYDTVRVFGDAPELTWIAKEFRLPVVDTIPVGTRVIVEAMVEDDQNFAIGKTDTVTVTP
jgi:hypothetical protein